MATSRRALGCRAAFAVAPLILSACVHIAVPNPSLKPVPELQGLPPSQIDVPIVVDLAGPADIAERAVPAMPDTMGAWTYQEVQYHSLSGTIGWKLNVARSPLQIRAEGSRLTTSVVAEYEAAACVRSKLTPWGGYACPQVASCGIGEPRPRIEATMVSELSWSPDWYLVSNSKIRLEAPTRCLVTQFNVDITGRVLDAVKARLDVAVEALDARIGSVSNMKAAIEQLWDRASRAIPLSSGLHLLLRPSEVRVSPLVGSGLTVRTTVGITARPMLVAGANPAVDRMPLPPLVVRQEPASGFSVFIDGVLPMAEASARLRDPSTGLLGRSMTVDGHEVTIADLEVEGRNGWLIVRAKVQGRIGVFRRVAADLILVGLPKYDPATRLLTVEDLDFSVETKNLLVRGYEWLRHESLRALIRTRAKFDVGPGIEQSRVALEQVLNGRLYEGADLSARLPVLEPMGLAIRDDRIIVRAKASGEVVLRMDGLPR